MADLMAKMAFRGFIVDAERWGLPVGLLRTVASSSYSYEFDSETAVSPWTNTMSFQKSELDGVAKMSPDLPLGEQTSVLNIYHEATHAWFDLKEDEPRVKSLLAHGHTYYDRAPLTGGKAADDPDRVFQEAMASYVGHRAASWWAALEKMTIYGDKLVTATQVTTPRYLKALKDARREYDADMGERVFGYQPEGWFSDAQLETKKLISSRMKTFADTVLLENKIPDYFTRSGSPKKLWDGLAKKYPTQLGY